MDIALTFPDNKDTQIVNVDETKIRHASDPCLFNINLKFSAIQVIPFWGE